MSNEDEQIVSAAPVFNDEWKFWIWHNIHRGIEREQVYEILTEKGFPEPMITDEIRWSPESGKIMTPLDQLSEELKGGESEEQKVERKAAEETQKKKKKDRKKTDEKIKKADSPLGIIDAEILEEVSNAS